MPTTRSGKRSVRSSAPDTIPPKKKLNTHKDVSTSPVEPETKQPSNNIEVNWERQDELNVGEGEEMINIPEVALEVAENIALASMSRMCRKGYGYDSDDEDDPRLRDAEYDIDKTEELQRLGDILVHIESKDIQFRPALLFSWHKSIAAAWYEWRERRKNNGPSHRCLNAQWDHEYSDPTLAGLPTRLAQLWFDTLNTLVHTHQVTVPLTILNWVCGLKAFKKLIRSKIKQSKKQSSSSSSSSSNLARAESEEKENKTPNLDEKVSGLSLGTFVQSCVNVYDERSARKKAKLDQIAQHNARVRQVKVNQKTAYKARFPSGQAPGIDICFKCKGTNDSCQDDNNPHSKELNTDSEPFAIEVRFTDTGEIKEQGEIRQMNQYSDREVIELQSMKICYACTWNWEDAHEHDDDSEGYAEEDAYYGW